MVCFLAKQWFIIWWKNTCFWTFDPSEKYSTVVGAFWKINWENNGRKITVHTKLSNLMALKCRVLQFIKMFYKIYIF